MSEQVLPIKQKIIETTGISPEDLANIVILYYYGNKFSSYKRRYYSTSSGKSWTEQGNGILLSAASASSTYAGIRFTQAIDFTKKKYAISIYSNVTGAAYNWYASSLASSDPGMANNDPGATPDTPGFNNQYSKWYDLGNNQGAVVTDMSSLAGTYYIGFAVANWSKSASGLLQAFMVL